MNDARHKNPGCFKTAAGFPKKEQTFSLEALLSEDADESQELCDLLQVKNRRVVELDDG